MMHFAVVYGPGLRWSVMGPLTTFFMAGGPDGYQHFFEHFGPTLTQPWTWVLYTNEDSPIENEDSSMLLPIENQDSSVQKW